MKKIYALLILLPFLVYSQNSKEDYDYFIQFNTTQFAKKVNIDSLFNHNLFKSFNKENSDIKLIDLVALFDKSKNATIHGNFTDSISYTQITLPIVDEKKITALVQKQINKGNKSENHKILKKGKYVTYSPPNDEFIMAWNKKYLVIYISYDTKPKNIFLNKDFAQIETVDYEQEEEYYQEEEEYEATEAVEEVRLENSEIVDEEYESEESEELEESEESEAYDNDYYDEAYFKKMREDNEKRLAEERKIKHERQSNKMAKLFKKGLEIPTCSKVNKDADISAWMDYQALTGKISSLNAFFGKMTPNAIPNESTYSIKGMNMDMFFENDKARIEQTIEYTEPLADVMKKVVSRKPNESIYNFFPKTAPLGYFTYHVSTAEMLKNYPAIIEQSFSSLPFEKESLDIVMDLMTTIIDEEATATLLDGDFTMFFHAIEKFDYTYKSVEYDEDYEEVEVEKTISKTKPVFSFIITSTHPKMGDKLLKLGLRKNVLSLENGNYKVNGTTEFGDITIAKDGDVVIFTNGLKYLSKGTQSEFSNQVKKESTENYLVGNLDIQSMMKSFLLIEDFGKNKDRALRLADQFKNIEFKASNKINGNTTKMEMNLNSNFSNKNIILQTLDLIEFMY